MKGVRRGHGSNSRSRGLIARRRLEGTLFAYIGRVAWMQKRQRKDGSDDTPEVNSIIGSRVPCTPAKTRGLGAPGPSPATVEVLTTAIMVLQDGSDGPTVGICPSTYPLPEWHALKQCGMHDAYGAARLHVS